MTGSSGAAANVAAQQQGGGAWRAEGAHCWVQLAAQAPHAAACCTHAWLTKHGHKVAQRGEIEAPHVGGGCAEQAQLPRLALRVERHGGAGAARPGGAAAAGQPWRRHAACCRPAVARLAGRPLQGHESYKQARRNVRGGETIAAPALCRARLEHLSARKGSATGRAARSSLIPVWGHRRPAGGDGMAAGRGARGTCGAPVCISGQPPFQFDGAGLTRVVGLCSRHVQAVVQAGAAYERVDQESQSFWKSMGG